nr:unnamed protein product [Callosobruchus analis]
MEKDNYMVTSQIDGFSLRRSKIPIGPRPESDVYAKHKNRGVALIFNHKNFTMNCEIREGTDKDKDDIKYVLEEIGFTVIVHNNLTFQNIKNELHRDPGTELRYLRLETDGDSDLYGYYTLPVTADFLVMYSTVEGHIAWRDSVHGSFFIQALVRLLRQLYKTEDLLSILTKVNKDVAVGFTSHSTFRQFNRMKEMSSIVSTLTRLFYLG